MKRKHFKKIAMQKEVMAVMEKNLSEWRSVAALEKKYDQFVRNLKKIDDYSADAQIDLAPFRQNKKSSKNELVERVFPVTSVLDVYAAETGDRKLRKLSGVTPGDLDKMKHNALVTYCIKVLKVSEELLRVEVEEGWKKPRYLLSDYGLTSGHLKSLQQALDAGLSHKAAFDRMRRKRKKSRNRIDRRIKDNDKLLKDNLDRMIHLFRESHPTFYGSYIKARTYSVPEKKVPPEKEQVSPVKKQGPPAKEQGLPEKEQGTSS